MGLSPELKPGSPSRPPVLEPGYTFAGVTRQDQLDRSAAEDQLGWILGFGIGFALLMILNMAIGYLLIKGVGIWGIDIPVGWGFAIVNFRVVDWESGTPARSFRPFCCC